MLAIIRINYKHLEEISHDEDRLESMGFKGIRFKIPQVRVLKNTRHKEDVFEYKPLLFSYGFLEISEEYLKNPTKLMSISRACTVLSGWFYRKAKDIKEEENKLIAWSESEDQAVLPFIPLLVETISADELVLLNAVASKKDVYNNSEELGLGNFVILKKYPLDGLSAEVLQIKPNGRIKVHLLDSGLDIWIDKGNVLYTPYSEEDSFLQPPIT